MASVAIGVCELAGDTFLAINILTMSMLVNFLLICVAVITLTRRNPQLAREIRFLPGRFGQLVVGGLGTVVLLTFLIVHIRKDLNAPVDHWYLRSTWLWLFVMAVASVIFLQKWSELRRSGADLQATFSELPRG